MKSEPALLAAALFEPPAGVYEALDAHRRRSLLQEIAKGGTTRKRLAISLRMRAGTVTQHVAELIESGLVREEEQVRTTGKGRPETMLAFETGAICAVVIRALSDRLHGTLLDLGGAIRHETERGVDALAISGPDMVLVIADIVHELKRHAGGSQLSGVVVSVPGIVDEAAGVWLFSSRFPGAAPLTGASLQEALGTRVGLQRALNAELRARLLQQPHHADETTILLHWGYGIGLSYASKGEVVSSARGAFGEVGHWRSALAGSRRCRCGEVGCLETTAALWALGAELDLETVSEDVFGQQLEHNSELAGHPLIIGAAEAVAAVMRDVYLLLVPNRVVVTGPFIQSQPVFRHFQQEFRGSIPHYIPSRFTVEAAVPGFRDEIVGAAKPLLHQSLHERLSLPRRIG